MHGGVGRKSWLPMDLIPMSDVNGKKVRGTVRGWKEWGTLIALSTFTFISGVCWEVGFVALWLGLGTGGNDVGERC
jgi:hypothetical protein